MAEMVIIFKMVIMVEMVRMVEMIIMGVMALHFDQSHQSYHG